MTRRTWLALTALSSTGVLASCSQGGDNSAGSAGPGSITWLNEETDPPTVALIQEAIRQYEESQGITVSLDQSPSEDTFQKLLRSIQAGSTYDIANTDPEMYAWLAEGGYLRSMDDIVSAVGGGDAFVPNGLYAPDEFTYALNICGLYYRTDWLDEASEDVPSNWDDLLRLAKKFTKEDRYGLTQPISNGQTTNDIGSNLLWSNGVEFFDEEWNVILDDSANLERAVQCLEFLKEVYPYCPPGMVDIDYGGVINTFVTELAGIVPYMGRLAMTVEANAPELADKFIYTGFPTRERGGNPAVTYSANQWVVPENSANADEAVAFLSWFIENKYVDFLLTLPLHFQSSLQSVYEDERWLSNPLIQKHSEMVETQRRMVYGEGFNLSGITLIAPGIGKQKQQLAYGLIIPEMYQRVIVNEETPDAAVKAGAQKLRDLLANAR